MTERVRFPRASARLRGFAQILALSGLLVFASVAAGAGAFPPQGTSEERQAAIAKHRQRLAAEPMDFAARLELARLLAQERDFAGALENYDFVLRQRPNQLPARVGRAQVLGWTGRYREAIAEVEKVLASDPRHYDARMVKAYNLLWLGELGPARKLFEELTQQDPRNSDAHEGLKAVADAERAPAAAPPAPPRTATLQAAERAEAEGNYAEAIRQYRQHLAQAPGDSDTEFRLARVLGWNREYAESERMLREYSRRYPANPEGNFQLARVLSWQEKYPEAIEQYRKGLALRPEADGQRVELARVLSYTGDHARALDEYRIALQMRPDNREAQLGVVEALIQSGETGTARREIERLSLKYPGDRQIEAFKQDLESATLRQARAQAATRAEVEARLRALVNENPKSIEARLALADVLLARNDFPGAIQEYRAVRQLRPGDDELHLQLARVLSWNQQYAESVQLYQEYLERHPGELPVRQEMARVMSWWRGYNASVNEYRRILAQNPDDTQARLEMARVLSWSRAYGPALAEFEELLSRDPKNFDAWVGKGRVHTYRQQWKAARQAFDTALEIRPGDREAQTARAQVVLWSGNPEAARKMLSELYATGPEDATVLLSMASAENSLGRPDRALDLLNEAERVEPRNADVAALRRAIQSSMRPELRFGWSYVRDTEGLNFWRYQALDFRFNLHPRLRNFVSVEVIPSSGLAEIFGYPVFTAQGTVFAPRVPVEPTLPAPTVLGEADFPSGFLVPGSERIAQNSLQIQFGGTMQLTPSVSLTASGGLVQLRHGGQDVSGMASTRERALWSVSPAFKLGRYVQISVGTARRYFLYTPKAVAQTVHADEYTGEVILSPDSRTRIAVGYYHRDLSPEFLIPDVPLPGGGTFAGRVFRKRGNGGTVSATRVLWRDERGEFEAGYDAMLFGYTNPEGLPTRDFFLNTGFFTPSFYQRHAGLIRVTLKPSRYLVWDVHGSAGSQQIRQGSDFSFSSTAGSRLDFVFTPDVTLSVGYDYFNTASALQALVVPGRAASYHSNNVYTTLLIRF